MATQISFAQNKERKDVPEKYKWDNSIIYKSVDEWNKDKEAIQAQIESLKSFQGKMGKNSELFYTTLRIYFDIYKLYYKLSDYAFRTADEDLRISANQSLNQISTTIGTKLGEAASFINPEILSMDAERIKKFFDEKKELSEFKFYISDILRLRAHTLSAREEEILASAGLITSTPSELHSIFYNAEKPNPKIKLSKGEQVELNSAAFNKYRTVQNRKDRELVMRSMFENYKKYQNTFGANLAGKVRGDYFYAKNRKYETVLESSLNSNNIPVSVYENLISQIHKNLPTLHRFLKLKAKMLGIDKLHYYDLYVPLVKSVDFKYNVEEGQKLLLDVFKPMGQEYVSTVKKSFDEKWIDYIPSNGKRSGAYSSGAQYDLHPYILMNWTDDFESVSTLAHELGHTMHSYYSNKSQSFVDAQYATFVAEIASTINETLLNNYMVNKVKTDEEKLYLLGSYLDLLRTTIFRQTSFAEFEWEIHKKIEKGEPLTGEDMSKIYYDIVKTYYGNDNGACIVDDYIAYEWAHIPHFVNYTYYVYQYSTSLIYATALAEKIVNEGQPAVDKFYNILKGGSSAYPIDLIKKAGLDPLSSEAFDLTMAKMNKVMDQMEEIIKKKKK
ncbi:MAG: oligoendopeptidase F [Stygiobacter sp. RIFOXYC12_FULL_38_8]|nr:MAG: oligoendopeptidase F [Stygiobacter sp. GWC2_38_9]OGV08718.1 MAG: oligoendopeptidase F [Stygiobacter sp. RIFOXYB2_FULL_37_11]OGV13513.1 MAG: oligoendopeptidase F [Stygiobacter sp. RIFOXYA2_FULL_38_8]OGV14839.1 MAG: oligoendopeptidase F [Stygiobacter sp. RIFOXYC2_FULL_38_25]OGV22328.1 MAG: oligoendopeptidase F [Stygiobacter sp. RIFOXYC12_FULL_38_8]OGV79332.1 MAG: oligoendopeptidase F [Stygiobacter sp. GWF2_38_21]RJQ57887.1 MAG: oligoendopeptidase F [Stygiobacter sp.]